MNEGISTGTCAAGAAKAAAIFLKSGISPDNVEIFLPNERKVVLKTFKIGDGFGVKKYSGDDKSDVTNGIIVISEIEIIGEKGDIIFESGEGVGTVTLPGMKIKPGEPAINPVPREMIKNSVREIFHDEEIKIKISIPNGEKIAEKTFNSRLGIVGGLSILGTSGIVRPENEKAFLDSINLEMNIIFSLGFKEIFITFGNSGEKSLRNIFNIHERRVIQCGNYPGYVLDEAVKIGFEKIMFCGHPGKLLKLASGSFNTHNKIADGRIEALCTHLALIGASSEIIKKIYKSNTTENAIEIIKHEGFDNIWNILSDIIVKKCLERLNKIYEKDFLFSMFINHDEKILGKSFGIESFFECLK